MPKVNARAKPLVHAAHGQHFIEITKLIDLAHRLGADAHPGKSRLIKYPLRPRKRFNGDLRRLGTASPAQTAGMHHDAGAAHQRDGAGAVQNIADAVLPLFGIGRSPRNKIRRVERQRDSAARRLCAERQRRLLPDAYAATALIFIGSQPFFLQPRGRFQRRTVPLRRKRFIVAGRSETYTHSVIPLFFR